MIDALPRTMIAFGDEARKFQFRTAAIIRREGYVLIHRSTVEDSWALPGGRVEMGEPSGEALFREMQEEMGVDVEVGPLAFVIENLFLDRHQLVHELGLYYAVEAPESFPFRTDGPCHTVEDGGATLEFQWVRNEGAALRAGLLFPTILCDRMGGPLDQPVHLLVDVR